MPEWKLADAEKIRANLTKEQENEISMLYRGVYLRTRKQMLAIPKDGTASQQIQRQYLNKLHKQLDEAYKSLGIGLEKQLQKEAKKAADGVVESSTKFLEKVGLKVEGAFSHVPKDIVNAIVTGQVYGGNWSLSGAIWADINKHQSDINKIIAEGVAANKSAYDIAKDLEKYVDPSAKKDWDWSKVYPGTSKKIDYNAQRLARTMVSHAYQQSLERVCKNNPFVDGYIWQAAHSGRVCPICEERDGKLFAKGDLPLDHPNGMCTFIAHMTNGMEGIADRLADWANGKEDPALDKWMADMTGKDMKPMFNDLQNKWLGKFGYSPENMPKNYDDWMLSVDTDSFINLLQDSGIKVGDTDLFEKLEAWYNQNLAVVRQGISLSRTVPMNPVLTADALDALFSKQSGEINKELNEYAEKWWSSLTEEEKYAIRKYTGSSYSSMNGVLRGYRETTPDIQERIDFAIQALNKASSPVGLVVGRGSNADALLGMLGEPEGFKDAIDGGMMNKWLSENKEKLIGTIAEDKGFLSTTPYEGGGFTYKNVNYRISVPKGSPGVYVDAYSMNQGEEEFLLQAGGKFRVIDIKPGDGKDVIVYMEYLKPEK